MFDPLKMNAKVENNQDKDKWNCDRWNEVERRSHVDRRQIHFLNINICATCKVIRSTKVSYLMFKKG